MKRVLAFFLLAAFCFVAGCSDNKTKSSSDGKPPAPPPGPTDGKAKGKGGTPVAPKGIE